jgi:hypothetical protein
VIPEHGEWVQFVKASVWWRVKFCHAGVVVCDQWREDRECGGGSGDVLLAMPADAVVDRRGSGFRS